MKRINIFFDLFLSFDWKFSGISYRSIIKRFFVFLLMDEKTILIKENTHYCKKTYSSRTSWQYSFRKANIYISIDI